MRFLIFSLIPLCLLAQTNGGLFPIPAMQEQWPGSGLTDTENRLLGKAINADLACPSAANEDEEEFDLAGVDLGKLGKAFLVRAQNSCSCGATGNCEIHLYVRRQGKYRQIPLCESARKGVDCEGASGWAFAVVKSDATVPDLVFAANSSPGENDLALYRYQNGKFILRNCERLLAKGDGGPKSWWNALNVDTRPCDGS